MVKIIKVNMAQVHNTCSDRDQLQLSSASPPNECYSKWLLLVNNMKKTSFS